MRPPHLFAALTLAACTGTPGDLDADGVVDCRDLDGTYEAEAVRLTGDPYVEDFDGAPDLTLHISFRDRTFTSTMWQDGEIHRSPGEFFADRDGTLVVTHPLLPGMAARVTRFDCAYDGDEGLLRLSGPTGYAFGSGGELVEADLDATFVRF